MPLITRCVAFLIFFYISYFTIKYPLLVSKGTLSSDDSSSQCSLTTVGLDSDSATSLHSASKYSTPSGQLTASARPPSRNDLQKKMPSSSNNTTSAGDMKYSSCTQPYTQTVSNSGNKSLSANKSSFANKANSANKASATYAVGQQQLQQQQPPPSRQQSLVGASSRFTGNRIVSTRPRGVSKQQKITASPVMQRKFSDNVCTLNVYTLFSIYILLWLLDSHLTNDAPSSPNL